MNFDWLTLIQTLCSVFLLYPVWVIYRKYTKSHYPNVILRIIPSPNQVFFIEMDNIGKDIAYDIWVFSKRFLVDSKNKIHDFDNFKCDGLNPGEKIIKILDVSHKYLKSEITDKIIEFEVIYFNKRKKKFNKQFCLDFEKYKNSISSVYRNVLEYELDQLIKQLKK